MKCLVKYENGGDEHHDSFEEAQDSIESQPSRNCTLYLSNPTLMCWSLVGKYQQGVWVPEHPHPQYHWVCAAVDENLSKDPDYYKKLWSKIRPKN